MNIHAIFEELKAESGKNAKLEILQREKKNELFKAVIEAALNPFKMYYIKKIPTYSTGGLFDDSAKKTLKWALKEIESLTARTVTGKAAQGFLVNVLESLHPNDAKVIERVILKDLDCGVATSPNKVWPDLIPEYPIMLASPFEQKLVDRITWPAIVQLKCDGMRFNAVAKNGSITIYSRKGQVVELGNVLDKYFSNGTKNWVYDGELLVLAEDGKTILPRKEGNGILNKAIKGTISKNEAQRITFKLWDLIGYEAWLKGLDKTPYQERLENLGTLLGKQLDAHLVPTDEVSDIAEATAIFERYLAAGQEGIILKDASSPWENKRSKQHIKMKGEFDADLECYGWAEGTKKNKGKLGALQLRTADQKLKVDCGTGLSDEQRATLQEKDVVGKIISIRYNAKIQKENGDWSLFLPVFLEIREDKDKANTFKELKG